MPTPNDSCGSDLLARGVAYSLGNGNAPANAALLAMLEKVAHAALNSDIKTLLSDLFATEIVSADPQSILAAACSLVATLSEEQAAAILAVEAPRQGFRYDPRSPALGELAEFVDARLNAVLVMHLMRALNTAIADGDIEDETCFNITERILADGRARTNPIYVAALEGVVRRLQQEEPNKPIIYLSIGCGSGREDVDIMAELKRRLPVLELSVVGFDPHQKEAAKTLITAALKGTLINRELAAGETFVSLAREATGERETAIIATERYALHHLGRTPARFLAEIGGATLVSVEEPVTELQRTSLPHRLATVGYDILANHALERRFGGSWITEARQKPALFGALYRRLEALKAQKSNGVVLKKVGDVRPATYVITYPARGGRAV